MDKNVFQIQEFLAASNSENIQYFVVQENGTLHLNEFMLPSTILSTINDSNDYSSSYILQPDINNDIQQMEEDTAVQCKDENIQEADVMIINESRKENHDCTQIMISDEQYQMLEQKGRVLLKSNDKIFVLNTLGLHDITTNYKLIEKLANEENNFTETELNSIGETENYVSVNSEQFFNQSDDMILDSDNEGLPPEISDIGITHSTKNKEENDENGKIVIEQDNVDLITYSDNIVTDNIVEVTKEQNGTNYKIKTDLIFEDIPDKIILGKTANGKRLVAKVVKSNKPIAIPEGISENKKSSGPDISNSQFIGLLKRMLRSSNIVNTSEDISAAEALVDQLIKVPTIAESIMGQHLFITKSRKGKDTDGKLKKKPTLVMGKVQSDRSQGKFVHLPNLLQCLINKSEETKDETEIKPQDGAYEILEKGDTKNITIFHVHESKTLCEDKSVKVNIKLTKRQLSIDSIVNRRLLTNYACGACATIFNSVDSLTDHQKNLCLKMDDNISPDNDNITRNEETYKIVKSDGKKFYCCLLCDARSSKSTHIQMHINTHFPPASPEISEKEKTISNDVKIEKEKRQFYKCKMCPALFLVPATLTKHILTKHIKLKTN